MRLKLETVHIFQKDTLPLGIFLGYDFDWKELTFGIGFIFFGFKIELSFK